MNGLKWERKDGQSGKKGKNSGKALLKFLSVFLTIKEGIMKKLISVCGILLMFFLVAGTGCNTMEGAGKDVEKAGEKVKDAAD